MADQPTTPSGSRWEPTPEDTASAETAETTADPQTNVPSDAPSITPPVHGDTHGVPPVPGALPAVDPEERRAQLRSRAVLAGAATALALGGGLAGFVIGHSTASDDANGFRPANFSGQQPGGQFGDGTQQGPPSFGDRDGDGDNGFGPPPQGNNGSSDGTSSNSSATSVT